MKRVPTICLWLDSGDLDLVNRWMSEGSLPHLAKLERDVFFADLCGFTNSLAEIVQSVSATGCGPETNHYWGTRLFDRKRYRIHHRGGCEFEKRKPFFALGEDARVAVVDFPQYRLNAEVNGLQVGGWGAHAPMVDFSTIPPEFAEEIESEIGAHPTAAPGREHANMESAAEMQSLFDRLLDGIELRRKLFDRILEKEPWDLFVACLSETHKGGHYYYPSHGNQHFVKDDDPFFHLREIYSKIDDLIGGLRERWGEGRNFVVYSIEGIGPNNEESDGIFVLPEILIRDSFGRGAFDFAEAQRHPSPEKEAGIEDWTMEAWHCRRRIGRTSAWLREMLPPQTAVALERLLRLPPSPIHPLRCDYLNFQPAMWLQPYWRYMRAFALPTFSSGFVRINLRGREGRGVVPFHAYDAECERITQLLREFHHPETGEPMVTDVERTRKDPLDDGLDKPLADLVVSWNNECGEIRFVSDRLGEIGPVLPLRSGSHIPTGFCVGAGASVPLVPERIPGHVLHFAPTILHLAGLQGRQAFDRPPLVLRPTRLAACLCIRNEERFLAENLRYHHAVGVEKIFLFLDRCDDRSREIAASLPWVEAYELDPAETETFSYISDIHFRCMNIALSKASAQGFDWLLTLDADEFAYGDNLGEKTPGEERTPGELLRDADLTTMLSDVPEEILEVRLPTREVVPCREKQHEPYYRQSYFCGPKLFPRMLFHPVSGESEPWEGNLGHTQGKSVIRTTARVSAFDSHRWAPRQAFGEDGRLQFAPVPAMEKGWHAHFFLTSADHLEEKGGKHGFQPGQWPCQSPVERPIQIFKEACREGRASSLREHALDRFIPSSDELAEAEKRRQVTRDDRLRRLIEHILETSPPPGPPRDPEPIRFAGAEQPDTVLDYSADVVRPELLEGFYPVELLHNTPFRWMRPEASIRLLLGEGEYRLRGSTIAELDPDRRRIRRLRLRVGDRKVNDLEIDLERASFSARVELRAGESGDGILRLEADRKKATDDGERILAFALNQLVFEKV